MDIYGWWVLEHHPESATVRQLAWREVKVVPGMLARALYAADYHFVAAHAWARQTRLERAGELLALLAAELRATARDRWATSRGWS